MAGTAGSKKLTLPTERDLFPTALFTYPLCYCQASRWFVHNIQNIGVRTHVPASHVVNEILNRSYSLYSLGMGSGHSFDSPEVSHGGEYTGRGRPGFDDPRVNSGTPSFPPRLPVVPATPRSA
ncbi:hypothetical protein J6590_005162 [Homalodisca vitripennis]|nr:hypothetical protein J6590_005162 [Homalodisca vitripennis]